MRKIYASRETSFEAEHSRMKVVKVYGFFPIDRADCVCQKEIIAWKRRLGEASEKERHLLIAQTPHLECTRDKTGMTRYGVFCSMCNQLQGVCWATDPTLKDWCDFHYVQWTKGDYWRGCLTPHISPISQKLLFECTCGQDTRDFRANMTLPQRVAEEKELENAEGRVMGLPDSKFYAKKFRKDMLI